MKRIFTNLLILVFMVGSGQVMAQNTVSGTVTDEANETLPGVSVLIKGTSTGTVTDTEGNFNLNVTGSSDVLVFSYVGYATMEMPVGNQTSFSISLEPDVAQLEELVVVGYGTQRKKDITGSVAVVDTEEMAKSQYVNITDRLQGRVAGVTVTNNGEPGSTGDIKIRGTSFFGGNQPLFVIDGILTDDSPNLNPNDVETIQVLKDASATAIYGNRAANGVVVITTKKGRSGKPEITFSTNVGIQQIPKRIDVMDEEGWGRISLAATEAGGNPADEFALNPPGNNTDWQEEMFNDQALFQDFNLGVSGGGQDSRIYFSVNSTYQEGTIKGPLFDRVGTRLNTEFDLIEGLTLGENLTVSRIRNSGQQNLQGVDFDGDQAIPAAVGMLPVIPVYDPTKTSGYGHGEPGMGTTFTPNPIGIRDEFKNRSSNTRILGNVFLNYDMPFIEGLSYRFSLGIDANFGEAKNYWKGGQIRMTTIHQSGMDESRSESRETFIENRLTYQKSINKHNFTAMFTHTEQELNGSDISTAITGGFDQADPNFQISATFAPPNNITTAGTEFTSVIRSYLGRLTYNYDDRYLFTTNIRRDGSSKFASENRWGTFPSVSAGWNITNESFFNVPVISDLKLRVGYGQVGNASIDDYAYQATILAAASGGVNYNLGPESVSTIGGTRANIVDRGITWEKLTETNIGLDLTMFDGRLEIIGDYYFGEMDDLLTTIPIPLTAGVAEEPTINAVTMDRNGWEAAITYRKITGAFQYEITGNVFHTNNEVTSLPFDVPEFPGDNSISRLGLPLGQLFVLDYQGIYETQAEIDALPPGFTVNGEEPQVGDAKFRDVSGRDDDGQLTGEPDGAISFDDDRILVDRTIPNIQYGLNFSGTYKNFDFTLFFQGVAGRNGYNSQIAGLSEDIGSNFPAGFDPYIEGQGGTFPRVIQGGDEGGGNYLPSTLWVENAGYLRLKNIQIGYMVPWDKVTSLRVYLAGQNLFTVTDWTGLDPEFEGDVFEPGVDPVGFPNVRIYSAGFNLTF